VIVLNDLVTVRSIIDAEGWEKRGINCRKEFSTKFNGKNSQSPQELERFIVRRYFSDISFPSASGSTAHLI
jgi:hypothetical protein